MITIYTDGACTSSGTFSGVGGWAYSINTSSVEFEDAGGATDTTNNRMEIEAVIRSLTQIKETRHLYEQSSCIVIHTDSELIVNTMTGVYQQKKNLDKWHELTDTIKALGEHGFTVQFVWVKAHSTNDMNNRVDKLATQARDLMKQELVANMDMQVIL